MPVPCRPTQLLWSSLARSRRGAGDRRRAAAGILMSVFASRKRGEAVLASIDLCSS